MIEAANQIGIDQNVLNTTLAKLRSSNFSKIAPAINTTTMPQLIPDRNPELIFPYIYVTINIGVFRNSPCSIIRYHKHG
jgi:hypothetical protein